MKMNLRILKKAVTLLITAALICTMDTPAFAEPAGTAAVSAQKTDTVTIMNNPTKVYDGQAVEAPSVKTNGGGTVTFTYYDEAGTPLESAPTNAGSYKVVAHEAATVNYAASDSEPQAFTIVKRKVVLGLQGSLGSSGIMTVTAVVMGALDSSGSVEFDYNSSLGSGNEKVNINGSGIEYSADITLNYGSESTGTASVTAKFIDKSGNYSCDSSASGNFDASLITRSITGVSAISLTYGDGPVSLSPRPSESPQDGTDSWSYTVGYDSVHDYNAALACTAIVDNTGAVTVNNAGTVFIMITLHNNSINYTDDYVYVPVTVSPKTLTVTPLVKDSSGNTVTSVPYGQAGTLTYNIAYSDSTYTNDYGSLSLPGLTNATDAGTYSLYPLRNGSDLEINDISYTNVFYNRNYALTFNPASFTVTPVAPTLTVSSEDMMIGWGKAFLPVSANAAGVNGETVSGNLVWSATQGGAALDDTWKFSGTAGGSETLYWTFAPSNNKNYTTVSGSTDFTLKNKNAVSINLTADKQSGVTYGDPVTYRASLVNADNKPEAMTGDLKLYLGDSTNGKLLTTAAAGSEAEATLDKSVLVSGRHVVTAVYDGCDYYMSASADTVTDVAKRTVTASAQDVTVTAGDPVPAFTVNYSGIADGEDAAGIFDTQAAATCSADGTTAGTYPIVVTAPVLKAAADKCYTVGTPVNAVLTVKQAVTVSPSDQKYAAVTAPALTCGTVTFCKDSTEPYAQYMRYKSDGSIFNQKCQLVGFSAADDLKLANAGYSISLDSAGRLAVTPGTGTLKSVSVKAIISGNGWSAHAVVPVAIKYLNKAKAEKKRIILGNKKVYFNTAVNEPAIPAVTTSIEADNGEAFADDDITVAAAGTKAADTKIFEALTITKDLSDKLLTVSINKSAAAELAGSGIRKGCIRLSYGRTSVTMTVNLISAASGSVKLSARGSINLAERDSTYVLVTPKMAYSSSIGAVKASIGSTQAYTMSGKTKTVQIQDAASAFSATAFDSGAFIISAKTGVSVKTVSRLYLPVTLTLSDGSSMDMTVPVKLVNRVSKVKASPSVLTCSLADTASQNLVIIKTGNIKYQYGEIAGVMLESSADSKAKAVTGTYYSADLFSYADEGLAIKNASALKKNRTYTLRFRVKFKDQAENAADTVVNVRVKVR